MTITSKTIRLICGLAMLAPIVGCLGEGPTGGLPGHTPGDGVFTEPQSVYSGAPVEHAKYPNGGIFNKAVLTRIARVQAQKPRIVQVTDKVWVLVGYHWGYAAILEGDTGLIIYDTGDDIKEGKEILELAQSIRKKPISAIIYSHAHYVHGAKPLVAAGKNVRVIGNRNINRNMLASGGLGAAIPELAPVLMARTFEQFSVLLPDKGPDAKAPTPIGTEKGFVPVNTPVKHGQEMTVDGVKMVFYTDFDSDTDDQVMVYLPESETVLNNHLWPTFPNFYTLRGSVYRDPLDWAGGIRLIRELNPKHLVNTHSLPISGKAKVRAALNAYYDSIMYLYDQTLRGILHGKTPDELRYWVQLPQTLADVPNNQMSYGEFSYYPPYIYQYALGWFGRDAENLNPIAPDERAAKIVAGFGGKEKVKGHLRTSLDNKEYAWAAELGGYLVRVAPKDKEARQLLANALRHMGYNTEATIPRSWYLTRALALEGKLHIPTIVLPEAEAVVAASPDTYVRQFRVRIDPRAAVGKEQLLAITITDSKMSAMGLHVRNSVAEFIPDVAKHYRKPDVKIELPHKAWADYYVGNITLDDLLKRDGVKTDDAEALRRFFGLVDTANRKRFQLLPPARGS